MIPVAQSALEAVQQMLGGKRPQHPQPDDGEFSVRFPGGRAFFCREHSGELRLQVLWGRPGDKAAFDQVITRYQETYPVLSRVRGRYLILGIEPTSDTRDQP